MTDTKKDGAKRPCIYMLRCKDGSLYTGWTNDFEKRLAAHQSGKGAKYTRSHLPVEPVYLEYLPDKIAATRREAEIKKLTAEKNWMRRSLRSASKAGLWTMKNSRKVIAASVLRSLIIKEISSRQSVPVGISGC